MTNDSHAEDAASGAASQVLNHHLGAFAKGVDELMADYTDDSIIFSNVGTFRGRAEIRAFFENFLKSAPDGLWEAFKITVTEVTNEVAYIAWEAKPWVPLGTDTLVVSDGKIAVQTYTAYSAP
ncbi:nuclear transport factor 2 family protein [Hwanghaeella grinnelliae]|uniref:Nuclear transport factor 2 family protein n=2 Tax=Hwanghaeella grinnelliae TaxID=2500179 RepID=A0A3S2VN63_9PROT|nr:nuclear transport factor 2 family protein [Hwanghaeella grinnelliae]